MNKNFTETASDFFRKMGQYPALVEHIKAANQIIQLDPDEGQPFYVEIRQGKVDFGEGRKYSPDMEDGLYITGRQEAMASLFQGERSLAEAIYDHQIRIPGYRRKEPLMVWFSKLLRKGRGLKE